MYVRQMRKSDEEWLLAQMEEHNVADSGFRSRDYVLAIDTDEGERCGFGRLYRYTPEDGEDHVEFANIVTFSGFDESRARSLIFKSLFEKALEYDCRTAYIVSSDTPAVPFEFEECDPAGTEVSVDTDDDDAADQRVFRADVFDALDEKTEEERLAELADEFGYDEDTTTKYSID